MTSPPAFRTCRARHRRECQAGPPSRRRPWGRFCRRGHRVFDLDPRICDVVKSSPGIFLETTRQQTPDADRRIGRQRIPVWFGPDNGADGVRDGLASES